MTVCMWRLLKHTATESEVGKVVVSLPYAHIKSNQYWYVGLRIQFNDLAISGVMKLASNCNPGVREKNTGDKTPRN